jgi:N,N'-diacetylchitobiose non-reducing end deacetylase
METSLGLSLPELDQARNILAIQPHYDDNDIAAGGTLLSLARAGATLTYLTVTDDLAGVIDPSWPIEQAHKQLASDREKAGDLVGVREQILLGFPDSGWYDYYAVRDRIIDEIRRIRPDFIFTVDPWTPYEAHQDHILTGRAAAEAATLFTLPKLGKLKSGEWEPFKMQGVVFYNTSYPNRVYDISAVLEDKNAVLHCYSAQFTPEELENLVAQTTLLAAYVAQKEDFTHGEALKVMASWMLHGVPMAKSL